MYCSAARRRSSSASMPAASPAAARNIAAASAPRPALSSASPDPVARARRPPLAARMEVNQQRLRVGVGGGLVSVGQAPVVVRRPLAGQLGNQGLADAVGVALDGVIVAAAPPKG